MKLLILLAAVCVFSEDAILIDGQSNAATTYQTYIYSSDSVHSRAKAAVDSGTMWSDTAYGKANGSPAQYARGVGAWGARLAQRILQAASCSLFVVNNAIGGTTIQQHLPSRSLNSYYGRSYWRLDKDNKRNNVKFIFWWQGEAEDSASSLQYLSRFTSLDSAWRVDYPNLRRIFIIRPRLCTGLSQDTNILSVINSLPSHFDSLTVISVDNISGWDGCHWNLSGYTTIGDTLYNTMRRVSNYPIVVNPPDNPIPSFFKYGGLHFWFY